MKTRFCLIILALQLSACLFGQTVKIGDILCTDGSTVRPEQFASSGKTAEGIVFYIDNTGTHGWAVSLDIDALDTDWVTETYYSDGYDIPDLPNCEYSRQALYDMDGYQNTAIIRATHGPDWYPAAWSVDFDNGWYLPAAGQMRWLLAYVNEINASLAVVGGSPFVLPYPDWHWTSTEYGSMHAVIVSRIGSVSNYMKWNYYSTYTIGVRSIKNFECNSIPEHKIGDVVIASGGQKGIIFYVSPDDGSYWLTALNDLTGSYSWGNDEDITELNNIADEMSQWYGMQGIYCGYDATKHIRDTQGNNTAYAANYVDFENGWHIPSTGQLSKLYAALPHIEGTLLESGGSLPSGDLYWTCTENSSDKAWAIDFGSNQHLYQEGRFAVTPKQTQCKVRPIWSQSCETVNMPTVESITTPEAICDGEELPLQTPLCQNAETQGWQLSPTTDFINPIPYEGEPLDSNYNGWYLRYFASNINGTVYSNSVCISIWPTYTTSYNASSCVPFEWNDTLYNETGVYTQKFTSTHDCDSIVTLHLTILDTYITVLDSTVCESLLWNEIEYTQSGHYEQSLVANNSCDSLVWMDLTVLPLPDPIPEIFGRQEVYVSTDIVMGQYNYSIDSVAFATHYEWVLEGANWPIDTTGTQCTLLVTTPGMATLKARAWNGCGYSEQKLIIHAGFFDIDERPTAIAIYPNPAHNKVFIEAEGITSVRLFDLLGQCLLEKEGRNGIKLETNINNLPPAIYVIEVKTEQGRVIQKLNVTR